jgi:hypothetical protein
MLPELTNLVSPSLVIIRFQIKHIGGHTSCLRFKHLTSNKHWS